MSADLKYPGGRPFRREDSGKFFGRSAEAAQVSALWLQHPLTFMSGPAGIGKTSLLAAGVLPIVNRHNVELLPLGGFSRGSSSPATPPGQHTPYTLALLRSWSRQGAAPQLDPFTVDEFVARHAGRLDPSVLLLVAIDQADDLFAGPPSRQQQRQRFLRELADALQHPSLRLLISVRDEALPRFTEVIGAGEHIRLRALEPDLARQAVERTGCFDPHAARALVDAIRTSRVVALDGTERQVIADHVEPALLQAACFRLWELLRPRVSTITQRELRRHGDVDAVLSAHCGAALATVADVHGIPVAWLRYWLLSTFIATISGERRDVAEGPVQTADLPNTVARALEDRHLLRARAARPDPDQHDGGQPSIGPQPRSRLYRLISDRIIEPLRHAPDDVRPDGDPGEYLLAAERALTTGELGLAERYAELARLAAPETDLVLHGNAWSLLGNVAREKRELDLAEAHYREALRLFEAAMERVMVALLLAAIGRTLIDRGDLVAGTSELHAAVRRMPADTTIQAEFSAAARELAWRLSSGDGPPAVSPA